MDIQQWYKKSMQDAQDDVKKNQKGFDRMNLIIGAAIIFLVIYGVWIN